VLTKGSAGCIWNCVFLLPEGGVPYIGYIRYKADVTSDTIQIQYRYNTDTIPDIRNAPLWSCLLVSMVPHSNRSPDSRSAPWAY